MLLLKVLMRELGRGKMGEKNLEYIVSYILKTNKIIGFNRI